MDPDAIEVHPLAQQVAAALQGAVYPLDRRQLVIIAQENEAPRMLLTLLSGLPNQRFVSDDEITRALDRPSAGQFQPRSPHASS